MDLDIQIKLGHLLLYERECRCCGQTKNLIEGFYRTRKNRGASASSFSYECKDCTIKRIIKSRKDKPDILYDPVTSIGDIYPDW